MLRSLATLAAACALALPFPAAAQRAVAGVVVDSAGRPITEALVTAADARGELFGSVRSDSAGRFAMRVATDSARVTVRRLGWTPLEIGTLPVTLLGAVTLELTPLPQALRAVVVEGSRYRGGFADRMARGGYRKFFLDSTAIAEKVAREDVRSVSSLVDRIPFMKGGAPCVVLDGWFMGRARPAVPGRRSLYDQTSLGELRGVEVYETGQTAPAEVRRMTQGPGRFEDCGRIVVLWTRNGFAW